MRRSKVSSRHAATCIWALGIVVLMTTTSLTLHYSSREVPVTLIDSWNAISYPTTTVVHNTSDSSEWKFWKMTDSGDKVFQDPCGVVENCVISMGLYGQHLKYLEGAIRNTELQKIVFPGWRVRVYHDTTVPEETVHRLLSLGAEIVQVDVVEGEAAGMFWRFLVAEDPLVDRYIVRDSDSRLSLREREAVAECIASGRKAHVMRDHPSHASYSMSGGLWGARKGAVEGMEEMVMNWRGKHKYIADMEFLDKKVWPQIREDLLQHASYGCTRFGASSPFPTRRSSNMEHVGQRFSEKDEPNELDMELLRAQPAATVCRKHVEWTWG